MRPANGFEPTVGHDRVRPNDDLVNTGHHSENGRVRDQCRFYACTCQIRGKLVALKFKIKSFDRDQE